MKNRNICFQIALLLTTFSLAGCAVYPKRTTDFKLHPVASNKAVVYVYRLLTAIDSANPDFPRIFVNDQSIGKLSMGGYYAIPVEPGPVEVAYKTSLFLILTPWKTGVVQFQAKAGESYYVSFAIRSIYRITDFKLRTAESAQPEIAQTRLLEN